MRMKRFKDFKKRRKSKIKAIKDLPYNWVPTYNTSSPAPGTSVIIKKIEL